MEMHLQPLATTCFVSGSAFVEGARVMSFLVRSGSTMEIVRYDVLEPHAPGFAPEGVVACHWVHAYKPRKQGENPDRALKLTAENLFVALADPATEPTPENTRLVQFLALMLERKKILRPRGRSADGQRHRFEHARSKQIFEVPAGELTPEFFVAVQEQLSVLVGGPRGGGAAAAAPASAPQTPAEPAVSGSAGAESPDVPGGLDHDAADAGAPAVATGDSGTADDAAAPESPDASTRGGGGGSAAA